MYNYNGLKVFGRLIASSAFKYGLGHYFSENPWMALWMLLGLSNAKHFGAFITTTITVSERAGFYVSRSRPWEIIRIYPGKVLNKKGWSNCGIEKFMNNEIPKLRTLMGKCIVSVGALNGPEEIYSMLKILNGFDILAIEMNISCGNVNICFRHKQKEIANLCRQARLISRHPLIIKINANSDYVEISKAAQDNGINLIHSMNTLEYESMSLGLCSVSSYKNKEVNLRIIEKLRASGIDIPVIAGSGIWTRKDVKDYENAGANLFSVSHQFLYFPPWLSVLARMVG